MNILKIMMSALTLGKTVSLIVYYGNISHSLKIFLVLMRDGCHVSPWHVHILAFEGIVPKSGQPDSSPFICILGNILSAVSSSYLGCVLYTLIPNPSSVSSSISLQYFFVLA